MKCILTRAGQRAISTQPVTANEHLQAAQWLGWSPDRVAFWRDEAAREQDNHR